MEFITKDETILCIRIIKNKDSAKETRNTVTSFDARVGRVAPHVSAVLTVEEVNELELWLKDRTNLQSRLEGQPIEDTILESLPHILNQAVKALKHVNHLDSTVFRSIKESLSDLSEVLDNTERITSTSKAGLKQMNFGEEQKERLNTIKRDIEEHE
jgi:hypothetical protein